VRSLAGPHASLLDSGFQSLYNLHFAAAQQQFAEYERDVNEIVEEVVIAGGEVTRERQQPLEDA